MTETSAEDFNTSKISGGWAGSLHFHQVINLGEVSVKLILSVSVMLLLSSNSFAACFDSDLRGLTSLTKQKMMAEPIPELSGPESTFLNGQMYERLVEKRTRIGESQLPAFDALLSGLKGGQIDVVNMTTCGASDYPYAFTYVKTKDGKVQVFRVKSMLFDN